MRRKYAALFITFCACVSCLEARSQVTAAIYHSDGGGGGYVISGRPTGFASAGSPGSALSFAHVRLVSPLSQERMPAAMTGLPVKGLFKTQAYPATLRYRDSHALDPLSIAVPAAAIAYGVIALHKSAPRTLNLSTAHEIEEDHPGFHTRLDNYLQFSPAAAVIGLNLAGIRGEHDFADELCVYAVSSIIMGATVWSVKTISHEQRPDHSSFNSFPSGHTATAFAAAEWLRAEYSRSPWTGVAGYAAATATGILRVYNNRHWVSDVIAGAAFGFLSTRIAYAVNPWMERHIVEPLEGRQKRQEFRDQGIE